MRRKPRRSRPLPRKRLRRPPSPRRPRKRSLLRLPVARRRPAVRSLRRAARRRPAARNLRRAVGRRPAARSLRRAARRRPAAQSLRRAVRRLRPLPPPLNRSHPETSNFHPTGLISPFSPSFCGKQKEGVFFVDKRAELGYDRKETIGVRCEDLSNSCMGVWYGNRKQSG